GEDEAQDGDRLQTPLRLGLASHAVDVRGEDQTDTHARPDGGQAVADHVERAFHGFFLSVGDALAGAVGNVMELYGSDADRRRQCSSATASPIYIAVSSVNTYAWRNITK